MRRRLFIFAVCSAALTFAVAVVSAFVVFGFRLPTVTVTVSGGVAFVRTWPASVGVKIEPGIGAYSHSPLGLEWPRPRLDILPPADAVDADVPLWCLFAPAVIVAALTRPRRRPKPGHCPRCGYDLRSSPDACPECGTARQSESSSSP